MEPIPFHVPTLDERDIPGVVEVLRSGWVTTGGRCRDFEAAFAEHLGGDVHCVAVNSCTAALHLGLEAIGVRSGDVVLTTPLTFTATAEVVRYFNADPVFVDVDRDTGNLTPAAVERTLSEMAPDRRERVRAILPVHFAGLPCDSQAFEALAAREGLRLVEDAAHALPAGRDGQQVGRFGDVTAFSFYATKTLCTGEGGMAVTADDELAHRMRIMRLHGIDRDAFDRYRAHGSWYYEVVAPGFKYNMTDLVAALGLSQLGRVEAFQRRRAEVAAAYTEGLAGIDGLILPPHPQPGDEHAWHLYAVRIDDDPGVRDAFIEAMAKAGIGTSVHFIPLHLQPYYRDRYHLKAQDFPAATAWGEQEVSLPIFPALRDDQVQRVIRAFPKALAAARARVRS